MSKIFWFDLFNNGDFSITTLWVIAIISFLVFITTSYIRHKKNEIEYEEQEKKIKDNKQWDGIILEITIIRKKGHIAYVH